MTSQLNIRCAIYIRVNVAGRATASDAARGQRDATRAFIQSRKQHGWTCVGTYEDIGHSGGTLERPALRKLLADMKAENVDCVVIHSFDRLTRNMDDQVDIIAEFWRHDVTLVTVSPVKFVVVGTKVRDSSAEILPTRGA